MALKSPIAAGWALETSLDVEWVHAIAPNAKIVLLALPAPDEEEFQFAILYAAIHKLGSVISNSYGSPEFLHGPLSLKAYDQVISIAAAMGISVNYSSGDRGDSGMGTPFGASQTPADSPHATAVGGTSLGVPNGRGGTAEVGWGHNETVLGTRGLAFDPPLFFGNFQGAGGGESAFFPKPHFRKPFPARDGKGRTLRRWRILLQAVCSFSQIRCLGSTLA